MNRTAPKFVRQWKNVLSLAAITTASIGLSGCGLLSSQETQRVYSPSDGVRADVGPVQLRNILIVSREAGAPGRILGGLFNTSSAPVTLTFTAAGQSPTRVDIPADGRILLNSSTEPVIVPQVTEKPGGLEPLTISAGSAQNIEKGLPVLDGTLEEYRAYVPTPTPGEDASDKGEPSPTPHSSADNTHGR